MSVLYHLTCPPDRRPFRRALRRRLGSVVALLAVAALGAPAVADEFADFVAASNLSPKGPAMESFSEGDDSVHLRNGSLSYRIPLGQRYAVGGSFAYQLQLEYASNIWQFDTAGSTVAAEPGATFEAGVGWSLGFGRLLAPASAQNATNFWVLESGDGRRTRFYSTLRETDAVDFNVFYSRDNSYLRLKINGSTATVESGDGRIDSYASGTGGAWQLTSRADVFGNSVQIDRSVPMQWSLTDSNGRVQKIFFRTDPAGFYSQLVDRLELTAFGGTTAVYQLAYSTTTLDRPPQDDDPATAAQVTVPVLDSVTRPDGTTFTMTYAPVTGAVADDGRLASVVLPTGGEIHYTWKDVALPYLAGALHTADVVGVATRETLFPSSGLQGGGSQSPVGAWSFTYSLDLARVLGSVDQPRELTTEVLYPDGHRRAYKFSVYVSGNAANNMTPSVDFEKEDYGLPFTVNGVSAQYPTFRPGRLIYKDDGTLLRVERVAYERSACTGCYDVNARQRGRQESFIDKGNYTETFLQSDWNGLGHYRQHASWDNQATAPGRTTTIDYSGALPAASSPWVLGVYSSHSTNSSGITRARQSCIDPLTGLVLRERRLALANPSAKDLLSVHHYDSAGNRIGTDYYGGDVQSIGGGNLCTLTLPAAEQYASYTVYQHGAAAETGWLNTGGSVFLRTTSATIDVSTGASSSSAGVNDFTETLTYDAMARPTAVIPPAGHGGGSTIVYTPADLTASPVTQATKTVTVTDASGATLAETRTTFDAFGRKSKVEKRVNGGWEARTYVYDAMGRRTQRLTADGKVVKKLDFDPFGRPAIVRPPEGSVHDKILTYAGRDVTETVVIGKSWDEITQSVIFTTRTTTTRKDRHGRVIEIEVVDGDGETRTETFTLNLDGDVIATSITDGFTTTSWTDADRTDGRDLTVLDSDGGAITGYDALGHLTEQDFGHGTAVSIYDRAGRLTAQREGSASGPIWTSFTYGTANSGSNWSKGRLVETERRNYSVPHLPDGLARVIESYTYGGERGLRSELRTEVVAGNSSNTTILDFESSRTVDALGRTVSSTFPDCLASSTDTDSYCGPVPVRTLDFTYDYRRLTEVSSTIGGTPEGWIDGITYAPGGFVTGRDLANGWVEQRTESNYGRGKLHSMTLNHPQHSAFYDSGIAVYDGLGRLVALGNDRHISDRVYALEIPPAPADAGTPVAIPSPPSPDLFGLPTERSYQTPNRYFPGTAPPENVTEIYLYGPGNRLLWTRVFSNYCASTYGYCEDTWELTDAVGQPVRRRDGISRYAGDGTFSGSTVSNVEMIPVGSPTLDRIFVHGDRIGESGSLSSSAQQRFFHRDATGRFFAETDNNGNVTEYRSNLQ